jgi:hypothetical protein
MPANATARTTEPTREVDSMTVRQRLLGDVFELAVLLAEWNNTPRQPSWITEYRNRAMYLRWACDYAEAAGIDIPTIKRNIAAGFTFVRCGSGEYDQADNGDNTPRRTR